jgi:hypothetical protein
MEGEIPPPPDCLYACYEEAYDALKGHGKQYGYGFLLQRSKPHNSDIKTRFYYHCDKYRTYTSTATKLNTGTRTTGCPFKLVIFKAKDLDEWRLQVTDKNHNHPPSIHPSAHNVHRKRTPAQKSTIQSMSQAGARPAHILAALQSDDPHTLVTATDIRSERKKIREEHLNGRSPIETLLDDLSTSSWVFSVKKDADNRIQNLFFAHRKQIELLLSNPDVLLMDCTYRTNKYKLPLLHILGCTNLQTFFSAGFCFIRNETELDYRWAVSNFLQKTGAPEPNVVITDHEIALKQALSSLLPGVPQLLCVWHINKNVLTKVQHTWRDSDAVTKEEKQEMAKKRDDFMKRWTQVVYAKRQAEFQLKWDELLKDYNEQKPLCEYLRENQYHTRSQWAAAWTSQYRHFNTITSSPLEGMHKVLKDHLATSTGDLLRVVERIEQMVNSQYNKYKKMISSSRHSTKFAHSLESIPFLPTGIHDVLTPPAIERIRQQEILRQKKQKQPRSNHPCSGLFEKTNGLPCHHTLQSVSRSGSTLRLDYPYDDHWRYQREQGQSIQVSPRPYQSVREPLPAHTRGRPRRNEASTRRDPSAFERLVPSSTSQWQPYPEPQGATLADILRQEASQSQSQRLTESLALSQSQALSEVISLCQNQSETQSQTLSAQTQTISAQSQALVQSQALTQSLVDTVRQQASQPRPLVSVTMPNTTTPLVSVYESTPTTTAPAAPRIQLGSPIFSSPTTTTVRLSSPESVITVSVSVSPRAAHWQPPTLEEFEADIRRRQLQLVLRECSDFHTVIGHLAETGQERDHPDLIVARDMALAQTGIWADCTPRMAWNFQFGDKNAYYAERDAQIRAREIADMPPPPPYSERPSFFGKRTKRAAAERAPDAWKGLSPRKRQRRQ